MIKHPRWRDAHAEAPLLGLAGFEIGEVFATDGKDQDVAWVAVQLFGGAGEAGAEFFSWSTVIRAGFDAVTSM